MGQDSYPFFYKIQAALNVEFDKLQCIFNLIKPIVRKSTLIHVALFAVVSAVCVWCWKRRSL